MSDYHTPKRRFTVPADMGATTPGEVAERGKTLLADHMLVGLFVDMPDGSAVVQVSAINAASLEGWDDARALEPRVRMHIAMALLAALEEDARMPTALRQAVIAGLRELRRPFRRE